MNEASTSITANNNNNSHQYSSDIIVDEYMSDSPLLDSLVSAANVVNKLFNASSCARLMCQVYTEKQIEFENRQDRLIQSSSTLSDYGIPLTESEDSGCLSESSSPVDRAYLKCSSNLESIQQPESAKIQIQMYRHVLFDEASVVDAVQGRSGED
jgi:hypothetical protein